MGKLLTKGTADCTRLAYRVQEMESVSSSLKPLPVFTHRRENLKSQNTPWPDSARELYRPSDGRLSGKLMPTFADRGCYVASVTNPYNRILGFLDRSRYVFFQVAPQLYSRRWVDPIPDPLLLRKYGSSGNRTQSIWICSQKLWILDHRGGHNITQHIKIHITQNNTPISNITQHTNEKGHITYNEYNKESKDIPVTGCGGL
jgi:hypothetical protein